MMIDARPIMILVCAALVACGDDARELDAATGTDTLDTLAEVVDASAPTDTLAEVVDTTEPADTAVDVDTLEPVDTSEPGDTVVEVIDTVEPGDTNDVVDTNDVDPGPFPGLADDALRDALRVQVTTGHTALGYNGARDRMYAHGGIDDHGGRIECIYTGRTVDTDGSRTPGDDCRLADGTTTTCQFNTEHTWARYHLDLYLTEGSDAYHAAESDIHHLHPSEEVVNNRRWHFDFGDTTCAETDACRLDEGSQLGIRPTLPGTSTCPTGDLDQDHVCVMRVRPERRGDVARGMLYMAVRYAMPVEDEMEAALRGWNLADPPDARERARNDAIEDAQGNRNPFVDHPGLVDRITAF